MLERVASGGEERARTTADAPGLSGGAGKHGRIYGRTMGVMPASEARTVSAADNHRAAETGADLPPAGQEPDLAWRRIVPGRDAWSPHPKHARRTAEEDASWLEDWGENEIRRLGQRVGQLERRLRRRTVALSSALVVSTGLGVVVGVFAAGADGAPGLWLPSWTARPPAEGPATPPGKAGLPSWASPNDEPLTAGREAAPARSEPEPGEPAGRAIRQAGGATAASEDQNSLAQQPAEQAQTRARVLRDVEAAIEAVMRAAAPQAIDQEPAFAVAAGAEPSVPTPDTTARATTIWPQAEAAAGTGAAAATLYATTLPAALRADARTDARILAVLSAGDVVRLVGRNGDWLEVEFSDGEAKTVSGFVLGKYLHPANSAPSAAESAAAQ